MQYETPKKKAPRQRCASPGSRTSAERRAADPRVQRWAGVFLATQELVRAALELAETAVVDVPEEREKVQRVRARFEAECAGRTPPTVDSRDVAYTIGLIATLADSDFTRPGISTLLVDRLGLSRAFERARARRQRSHQHREQRGAAPAICRLCHDEYQF